MDTADILNDSDYGALTGNLLICGNGGDSIHGTAARDIIEAEIKAQAALVLEAMIICEEPQTMTRYQEEMVMMFSWAVTVTIFRGRVGRQYVPPGEGNDSITGELI